MLEHEVHFLGSNFFSGNNKVAFILAVFVIYDNHKLAVFEVGNGVFDAVQWFLQVFVQI